MTIPLRPCITEYNPLPVAQHGSEALVASSVGVFEFGGRKAVEAGSSAPPR